jgi:hypothetical protein
VSKQRPGQHPLLESRAELALGELCSRLGYCLPPDLAAAILASPPPDAESLVDAVLAAEGRDALYVADSDKRPMLEIVAKWAVYELPNGAIAERPAFPEAP